MAGESITREDCSEHYEEVNHIDKAVLHRLDDDVQSWVGLERLEEFQDEDHAIDEEHETKIAVSIANVNCHIEAGICFFSQLTEPDECLNLLQSEVSRIGYDFLVELRFWKCIN
mmetsp:Transcript_27043/g.48882  ORF Transcript_27043/g.48882 Transcript_27043/m.48882 type:complete len:114 (-) Transcript_27043:1330-1671(-)